MRYIDGIKPHSIQTQLKPNNARLKNAHTHTNTNKHTAIQPQRKTQQDPVISKSWMLNLTCQYSHYLYHYDYSYPYFLTPTRPILLWAFKQPGRKKYKLLFHHGSFKKKVLKYGTPKPRSLLRMPTVRLNRAAAHETCFLSQPLLGGFRGSYK